MNLFIYKLKELEIPQFFPDFQSKIEQTVKSAHAKLAESKSLYSEAEDILLSELGLKNWHPRNTNVNVKKLKELLAKYGHSDILISLVADFDPYQASQLSADPNIHTLQFTHKGIIFKNYANSYHN